MHQGVATMIYYVDYGHSRVLLNLLHKTMHVPLLDELEAALGHLLDDLLVHT